MLELALRAARNARARGVEVRSDLLTVIDYTLPSTETRLWVFDLAGSRLLFRDLVAHGQSTGELLSRVFSNRPGSKQTSLGLFLTADTYSGRNGYSLRLHGLEPGVNDRALERAIVMHGADYVSPDFARARGPPDHRRDQGREPGLLVLRRPGLAGLLGVPAPLTPPGVTEFPSSGILWRWVGPASVAAPA